MIKPLGRAVALLTPRERRQGGVLLVAVVFMALLEAVSIASVMPFLSVVGNPAVIDTHPWVSRLYDALGFEHPRTFITALGVAAFSLVVFSAAYRAWIHDRLNRYIEMRQHSLSKRLLERYLRQPYAFFLHRHSGEMAKNVLMEVGQVVNGFLRPIGELTAFSVVALAIIGLLLLVDPLIAFGVIALFSLIYVGMYALIRRRLNRVGHESVVANEARFTTAGECLSGIKEVKLLGRESAYIARYEKPSARFSRHQATVQTLSELPVFAIEAIAFGGMILLTLVLIGGDGRLSANPLGDLLPLLGLYALAALRLKPAAQRIYRAATQVRVGQASLDLLYNDMTSGEALVPTGDAATLPHIPRDRIELRHIRYRYPQAEIDALADIDITLPVGSSLGVVGSTGAGKTTLVDVILGLLDPTGGELSVDGEPIVPANRAAWQSALGYVPQEIFLTDATIAENIAFGEPATAIDRDRVRCCAEVAQLDGFIEQVLEHGYDTRVGERGVRLSGGQRQRIGIARALYRDPPVIVFDEATSALDRVTEKALMGAIDSLQGDKTLILIAHRLSTVTACDRIVWLEDGRIHDQGSFATLHRRHADFRVMAAGDGEGGRA